MQRNNRHANFGFHFFGDRVDVFTDNSRGAGHSNKNSLGVKTFFNVKNRLAELIGSAEHHILFFQVCADVQGVLQRFSATAKAVVERKVKLGAFATTANGRVVNQDTIREVTHRTLNNGVRAHRFLVERRVQLAKFAT